MKLIISNYESGEVYEEVEDVTSTQITAYTSSDVIVVDEKEFIVRSIVTDYNSQTLSILVLES